MFIHIGINFTSNIEKFHQNIYVEYQYSARLMENDGYSILMCCMYCKVTLYYRYIQHEVLEQGQTGKVAFDESGDRINAEYKIINVQQDDSSQNKRKEVPVGEFIFNKVSNLLSTSQEKFYLNNDFIFLEGYCNCETNSQ